MSRATVTIRELKNKDTGIDLSVNRYKETKGMIGSTYEYQVMVVSNLSFFKNAKHKETDNVQFTVDHKFADFEDLFAKLTVKFSGTVLPPLPKKVLMMNDSVAKERRNSLDHFMKFLAMTPKLSTCPALLEFLGVSRMKAGAFRKMEVSDSIVDKQNTKSGSDDKDQPSTDTGQGEKEETEGNVNLFDDGEEDNSDDDDMFSGETVGTDPTEDTKIFDAPDLGGGLVEGEDDDLFITDARLDRGPGTGAGRAPDLETELEEENDDLFRIDDDLDQIMKLNLKPVEEPDIMTDNSGGAPEDVTSPVLEEITAPLAEEVKAVKRPKPPLKSKPAIPKRTDNVQIKTDNHTGVGEETRADNQSGSLPVKPKPAPRPKPALKAKPQLGKKPEIKPKPGTVASASSQSGSQQSSGEPVDKKEDILTTDINDDIMKYIQENAGDTGDDLDLFS